MTAASLDNTGSIYLTGSGADQALLDVSGSAGFGTAGVLSGYVRLAGDSAIEFKSGEITSLAASAHLGLVGSDAFIEDSTAPGSNSALKGLALISAGASLALHDGAAVSTTGALVNDGTVVLDTNAGDGGSSLTLAGALTNSAELGIGNATLSASDKVTAASFDNTGFIQLTGSGANQALLDVTAGSAGFGTAEVLSGHVRLTGDSAIEFAGGQITSLAASAELYLSGDDAFIEDSTALGSNSALTGLADIAGALYLEDGASVSTTGALTNTGSIYLGGNGTKALLDVTAGSAGFGTAGVLSGYVRLAGDSAIEFASGQITSLAADAHLGLNGSDAVIEDSATQGSNSALMGLALISAGASLALHDEAAVSTTGALVNDGNVYLDTGGGDGGSSLTLTGALTNSQELGIGNGALSASDKVTATSFDNTGKIQLTGSSANQALLDVTGSAGFGTAGVLSGGVQLAGDSAIEFASGQITSLAANAQLHLNGSDAFIEDSTALGSNSALTGLASIGAGATFDLEYGAAVSTTGALVNDGNLVLGGSSLTVAGALTNNGSLTLDGALVDVTAGSAGFGAAGVLSGYVRVAGDSAIEFATGQITSLAANAQLHLGVNYANGNDNFIEDSTALGSNSALTGLASIGQGAIFDLENGAAVSTTGALVNDGTVELDGGAGDAGGESLTVAGALTNNGSLNLGNSFSTGQPLLDVTAGVAGFGIAGVLSGNVDLSGGAIEFASGQISTIAPGASLSLNYGNAFIEDSTALGSNSALTGLADIAGALVLYGESLSTTGSLVNDGSIALGPAYGSETSLAVAGTLTNAGTLDIASNTRFSGPSSVTAKSFVNSGTVDLVGYATIFSDLNVSGTTTNNGSISIASDTEELAGAVGGAAGSFSLSTANLQFELERFVRADHHRDRRGRAHAQAGAGLRRHDQRVRNRGHDRRDELCRDGDVVQFPREFDGDRRHAHPARRESDRQYPDDRRLFELEFHPRPRQRDRHAGEVRLSRRPSRDPLREWCGNEGRGNAS